MQLAAKLAERLLPLIFGLGFLAPVAAEGIKTVNLPGPLGLQPIAFGLIIGCLWGLIATITGRWL